MTVRTYFHRRNAVQSAEKMETYSRTGSSFLAEMAPGMAARTQHAKEVAQEKTQHTVGRGGSSNFARYTTGKLAS